MNDKQKRLHRQIRSRKKTSNVTNRLRLSVFRSNNYVYAQIIDGKGDTIVSVSEKKVKKDTKVSPVESAKQVGVEIAKLAIAKKIKEVAFDKGRFAYHGRVKAVAEGAREGGLSL
ncbi:MAG TPA: 50S ribosomal protein L18 [Candidatus Acidoferrales bacterium]|nr:50S ribosomal protein L18 [Candidatus Acidoferrales bacterium]